MLKPWISELPLSFCDTRWRWMVSQIPKHASSLQGRGDLWTARSPVLDQLQVTSCLTKQPTGPMSCHCDPHCVSCTPLGSVPVALAIAACVLALLSLPLILLLVYKQRQNVHSSRRTYHTPAGWCTNFQAQLYLRHSSPLPKGFVPHTFPASQEF